MELQIHFSSCFIPFPLCLPFCHFTPLQFLDVTQCSGKKSMWRRPRTDLKLFSFAVPGHCDGSGSDERLQILDPTTALGSIFCGRI